MTTRIDRRFEKLKAENRPALVTYFMGGDPNYETSLAIMKALPKAGADVIELGMPFSDPMADGPTIQRSSECALARGAGLSYVFDSVRGFRQRDADTPVVLMGYLNPVEVRGAEGFAREAAGAGVDGVLLVDLPPEEAGGFREAFAAHGVALVLLASPTTTDARLEALCAQVQGYLYYVSFAGVTGASDQLDPGAASARLRTIRAMSRAPVVAGFGIRDAASAAAMAADADGVVVGSALVAALAGADGPADAAARAGAFLAPLRAALDGAGLAVPVR